MKSIKKYSKYMHNDDTEPKQDSSLVSHCFEKLHKLLYMSYIILESSALFS